MTGKMRQSLAGRERKKTLDTLIEISRRRNFRQWWWRYLAPALLWALLAALPSFHVWRPLPYLVGSTAGTDAYSRIDFTWHDAKAETMAIRNLESGYTRQYREEKLADWSNLVEDNLVSFLVSAATAQTPQEVATLAEAREITLNQAETITIWNGAAMTRNDPFHYLIRPLQEVLANDLFTRGVLEQARFDRERGRSIKVIRDGASYPVLVGSERGPIAPDQTGDFLRQRLNARYSVWISDELKGVIVSLILQSLRPNLVYDEAASNAELASLKQEQISQVQSIKAGDRLFTRGEVITLDNLAKVREEERLFLATRGWQIPASRFIGNFILFLAMGLAMAVYFRLVEGDRPGVSRRFLSGALLCLLIVFSGYWLIWMNLPGTMFPAGLLAAVTAIGMQFRTSIFLTALASLCGLILFDGRSDLMLGHLTAGWFFIYAASRTGWRTLLLCMALLAGFIGGVTYIAWNFARGDLYDLISLQFNWDNILDASQSTLLAALAMLVDWLVFGVVVLVFLPLIERFFSISSRITLQDLARQEHPILHRLIVEAPGTYNHSVIVSTLAEAGATAIGADGLKARIGGLFHDVGKLVKPEYFTENEFGVSRHDLLSPYMSALIIINHVKDGERMAKEFGLPSVVTDMILQHHGRSVLRYFFHKASDQVSVGHEVDRESFLYPGPRPQSREAAVLMMADIVEAAVRSLDVPSPQHIRNLIASLWRDRLLEGQFEESGITMVQLSQVADVFSRLLVSMFHTRVKYPNKTETRARRKG
ncbi:MAG: HDIG domain-containing protein [Planctomycetota bacterium]|jgi:putative nucleotidyltransferase with HDIG domain|nr:HDIG domain-containing protein [Planctomycetota bacterium]